MLNLYVVNGQEVGAEKYDYKLAWLKDVTKHLKKDLAKTKYYVVLGDFNIAPKDEDVYDPKAWKDKILCSSKERSALKKSLIWALRTHLDYLSKKKIYLAGGIIELVFREIEDKNRLNFSK